MSKENLKKLRSADKTILTNAYGSATVTKYYIGNLALPTGRIIMSDPFERYSLSDIDRKMFSRTVAPGEYPIWIYLAETESDTSLAFAELRFSENSPASFVAAKSQYDVDHHRTGYFGYPVSYGTGFMDAQAKAEQIFSFRHSNSSLRFVNFWGRLRNGYTQVFTKRATPLLHFSHNGFSHRPTHYLIPILFQSLLEHFRCFT